MGSTGLIVVLVIFVIISAFFSSSETAFSSANEIRLKSKEGNPKAERVLKILDNYDALLSTILIGNNIVNIGASAIATVLFVRYFGEIGATYSTIVVTVVVLIFAEVTPKSLAKEFPESYAMAVAPVMKALMIIFTPLNVLFSGWKKLIKKILRVENNEDEVTEDEFLTMVDEAEEGGGIDREDTELIHSVLEFNDIEVGEIFTPRVDVVAIPTDATKDEIAELFLEHGFSRLPVYKDGIDDIIGFIHQKDFYDSIYFGQKKLMDIINPVIYAAPTMKISKLLTLLQQKHSHIAIVTDEFGGTHGIITMEDILEELVGEIYDEHDEEEKDIVKSGKDTYIVRGTCDLSDFFEYFEMEDDEPESDYNSVAGFVTEITGHIPEITDSCRFKCFEFTVKKRDSRKIELLQVKVLADEELNSEEE